MVFYRKYRPQTLTELIGQEQVKQVLLSSFQNGKLAHAYLFCGPRGTGKTSTARILAKMVNCEAQQPKNSVIPGSETTPESRSATEASVDSGQAGMTGVPCNICASCLSITDGSNLDLVEIDAASNRGIDDIRELREKVKLAPAASSKKVYIIDEVHMLTTEAFNALLKTLEEPPSHVLFILATTEAHKIPQTILSRVQKLDFKLASSQDLVTALKNVLVREKLEAEEEALTSIAKKAEGSFRDCLKLLDQLSSSGQKITALEVENLLNSGKFEDIFALLESISKKDTLKALEIVQSQMEKGINLKEFILSNLEVLRSLMLLKSGASKAVTEDLGEEKFSKVKALANSFDQENLIRTINLLLISLEKIKFVSIPALPLEIAVVEACQTTVANRVPEIELKGNSETIKMTQVVQESTVIMESTIPSPLERGRVREGDSLVSEESKVDDIAPPSADLNTIKDKWQFVLETIRPYNFSLEALLKQAKLVSVEDGKVLLEVPYAFHQRILEAPKSREFLESVLSEVLGKAAKVSCVLGKRPVRIEEIANVELAADDEIIKVAAEIFNSES